MTASEPDHYAILGLASDCTPAEIRGAYRLLAKRHHPDLNHDSATARVQTQALNGAYEVLIDPARRRAYDGARHEASRSAAAGRTRRIEHNVTQEVRLRIEEFLRGTAVDVQVRDASNPAGPEHYRLEVPAGTAPGARFRLPRPAPMEGGFVQLRLKVLPGPRFKVRGSDLHCELRIDNRRATQGCTEAIDRPAGGLLRVRIPAGTKRGEVIRVPGAGMPRPRGGCGDLLVRLTYRPEVRIARG